MPFWSSGQSEAILSTDARTLPLVDLATSILRLRPRHRPQPQDKPLGICPHCGSPLVQPQGWRELPHGDVILELRCPECQARLTGSFEHDQIAEYDEALVKSRESIVADYEAIVRHNMAELSQTFSRALELDLIDADDFVGRIA